jgi:molecular chaperone GrpE
MRGGLSASNAGPAFSGYIVGVFYRPAKAQEPLWLNMEDELPINAHVAPGAAPVKNEKYMEATPGVALQAAPAPSSTIDVAELTATIQKLQAERQELYDRLLRRQAELENLRKRMEREKEDYRQYANADLIRALLPSLDGMERALKHRDPRVPLEFYKGMELIYQGLLATLKRHGVEQIQTIGQTFDPHLHHAVGTVEDAQHRDQEIVEELLPGYKLKDRLLRPSMVKVAVTTKRNNALADRIKHD